MKLTKTEKIWLGTVALFYVLYNLPFFPAYGETIPALLHGALTLIPLWCSIYIGLFRVFREQPLKEKTEKMEDEAC